uniref:Transcription factor MYC/MYB N-terminal domain-containing protein n=1 Tax=Rhizophora mucronata TaxID=61149 RepID=A0A2P2KB09_RHIMU
MEGGFPMLNCPLQLTLRSLCSCSNASSSKWVYAVFWRILPRNYPPPRWDYGGTALDRSKGNKRNWILVWEDGFCDFYECERAGSGYMKGRFGADVFFKMSHEVYNYGEGLVGKVAADDSHKWVFRKNPNENDPNFVSSWNTPIEPQPRAWEFQFSSGIQTIAIISVREGVIQLGSLDKVSFFTLGDSVTLSLIPMFCALKKKKKLCPLNFPDVGRSKFGDQCTEEIRLPPEHTRSLCHTKAIPSNPTSLHT